MRKILLLILVFTVVIQHANGYEFKFSLDKVISTNIPNSALHHTGETYLSPNTWIKPYRIILDLSKYSNIVGYSSDIIIYGRDIGFYYVDSSGNHRLYTNDSCKVIYKVFDNGEEVGKAIATFYIIGSNKVHVMINFSKLTRTNSSTYILEPVTGQFKIISSYGITFSRTWSPPNEGLRFSRDGWEHHDIFRAQEINRTITYHARIEYRVSVELTEGGYKVTVHKDYQNVLTKIWINYTSYGTNELYWWKEPEYSSNTVNTTISGKINDIYVELPYNILIKLEPNMENDNSGSRQYGNPNSSYVVELSPSRIYEGQRIKVYVIGKGVGWFGADVYVEGAEIYVDGQSTGVKTEYHNWWEPWFGWLPWVDKPYAEITLNEPGVHYVYAKLSDGSYSKASPVTVLSLSGSGSENGTYPSTPPESTDEGVVEYRLFAHPTVLYTGGEVTFKVYKYVNGENKGTVEAEIWINGEFVGKTSRSGWGDFELKHKFMSANVYYVYAVVDGKRTSIMQIRVLSKSDQNDRVNKDNGDVTLTVKVVDTFGNPLAGIYVERWTSDYVLKERTVTNSNGIAILHPQSGVEYLILAYDLGNKYLPASYNGSWTSDSSVTLVMGKAGDLNDDGKQDVQIKYIQVRVDGYAEDGHTFYVGKHRISVVDQNGMELVGVKVYVNGEYIGETTLHTELSWTPIWRGIEHQFGAGNYTIRAIYNDLADTITIRVIDAIDPDNPDRPCLLAKPDHAESLALGNVTAYVNEPVFFTVATPTGATSIWEWNFVHGAVIYVNGQQVGITGKTDYRSIGFGPISFGGWTGFVYRFNQTGTYEVYAITPDGDRTNTLHVTVVQGPMGAGWLFDNPIMQVFKGIALTAPILGDWHIDAVIWLLIALFVVSIVIRIVI